MLTQAEREEYIKKIIEETPGLTQEKLDAMDAVCSPLSQEELWESIGEEASSGLGSGNQ